MTKNKLVIVNEELGWGYSIYRIQWRIAGWDDEGAIIGDVDYKEKDLEKNTEEWECIQAFLIAKKSIGVQKDNNGFFWETKKEAQAALKAIKVGLKDRSNKPLEDWEIKALSMGWNPPKGERK